MARIDQSELWVLVSAEPIVFISRESTGTLNCSLDRLVVSIGLWEASKQGVFARFLRGQRIWYIFWCSHGSTTLKFRQDRDKHWICDTSWLWMPLKITVKYFELNFIVDFLYISWIATLFGPISDNNWRLSKAPDRQQTITVKQNVVRAVLQKRKDTAPSLRLFMKHGTGESSSHVTSKRNFDSRLWISFRPALATCKAEITIVQQRRKQESFDEDERWGIACTFKNYGLIRNILTTKIYT